MSEQVICDKEKICIAKTSCPLKKYIRDMIISRYKDEFICPKGLFYKSMVKRTKRIINER